MLIRNECEGCTLYEGGKADVSHSWGMRWNCLLSNNGNELPKDVAKWLSLERACQLPSSAKDLSCQSAIKFWPAYEVCPLESPSLLLLLQLIRNMAARVVEGLVTSIGGYCWGLTATNHFCSAEHLVSARNASLQFSTSTGLHVRNNEY